MASWHHNGTFLGGWVRLTGGVVTFMGEHYAPQDRCAITQEWSANRHFTAFPALRNGYVMGTSSPDVVPPTL